MSGLSAADLKKAKAEAKKRFGHLSNVVGFGIGEGTIIIYLQDASAKDDLPSAINDIPIECVVTGEIKPFAETA